jgi:hypothetical protein
VNLSLGGSNGFCEGCLPTKIFNGFVDFIHGAYSQQLLMSCQLALIEKVNICYIFYP